MADDLGILRQSWTASSAGSPGCEVGVTGPDALQADEMTSAMRDITLATWLSLVGQFGLLVLFLRALGGRWWKSCPWSSACAGPSA